MRTRAGSRDLLPLAAANPTRYPALYESAASGAQGRYDILFAFPHDALTLHRDGRVRDAHGIDCGNGFLSALDRVWRDGARPTPAFGALADCSAAGIPGANAPAAVARGQDATPVPVTPASAIMSDAFHRTVAPAPRSLPFRGGWLLFLGYELAGEIEPRLCGMPPAPDDIPLALAVRVPAAIVVDRRTNCTHLLAEPGFEAAIDAMEGELDAAARAVMPMRAAVELAEDAPERFLQGVAAIHRHLSAGDVFQVNLSREWRARLQQRTAPAAVFASLRRANPAPFSALLQWQDWAIVSSSPERLVSRRGTSVTARPIAGTRPRVAGDDDALRLRELIGHAKERAEHVMLIDLERNDLGRVCVPGSIRVDELMTLESYAHVHHIVSNVCGTLREGTTPGDIIRAMFPGGTITGCPKVRTMELIAELEGVGRGAYTGSLGYLNVDGDLDLNILIRSMTMRHGAVRFRAGAGIVADSVAERELEETRAKARGLLRALGIDG